MSSVARVPNPARHCLWSCALGLPFCATLLTSAACTSPAGSGSPAAAGQVVTLKLGHATFESHPFHDTAVRFKAAVERRSKGSVAVQIFPARQLGDVKELMQGVQFGTVDMAVNSSSAYATLSPSVMALQLPWVIESYAHFARVARTPETKAILASLEAHGTVALGTFEGGRRHFLTTRKAVTTAADFSGLKTRVAPERLFLDIWKAVGVNPTPMNYGEVYAALETSTLDAVEINLTSIQSEKYDEIAKHLTLTGHYYWPSLMVINKAVFDGLSPGQREAITAAADEILEPQVQAVEALDQKLLADFRARGMQIVEPSAELIAAMRAAVTPVVQALSQSDPKVAAFVAAAERVRARN